MNILIQDLFKIITRLESGNKEYVKRLEYLLNENCEAKLENVKLIQENIKLKTKIDMDVAELKELRRLNEACIELSDTESIDISTYF